MICPNKSSKEWKALEEAVGIHEATRDWLENNYTVRTPEEVLSKISDQVFSKTPGELNAAPRITLALLSDKTLTEYNRFFKANPERFYDGLTQASGEQQVKLLKDWVTENKPDSFNDLIIGFTSQYSHTVEIQTTKGYHREDTNEDGEPDTPTQYYSNMTVPGGTNYTENEIRTPNITPSIKGHAQFSTDNGIGWFRSDDQTLEGTYKEIKGQNYDDPQPPWVSPDLKRIGTPTKTRRILEVQSDLFQKGRNNEMLTSERARFSFTPTTEELYKEANYTGEYTIIQNSKEKWYDESTGEWKGGNLAGYKYNGKLYTRENGKPVIIEESVDKQNNFLQLLNKDNNWVSFFIKSIIQDSARKGYESVLFPTGDTASKVEGHRTLEDFKLQKEKRIDDLTKEIDRYKKASVEETPQGFIIQFENGDSHGDWNTKKDATEDLQKSIQQSNTEIETLKQELKRIETEGFGALRPIYNFYETQVNNILKKQGYKPQLLKDENGNTWNKVNLIPNRDLSVVAYLKPTDALRNIFTSYNANDRGFFPKSINPDQLRNSLRKADLDYQIKEVKDDKGNITGYYLTDNSKKINAFFKSPRTEQDIIAAAKTTSGNDQFWAVVNTLRKSFPQLTVSQMTPEEAQDRTKNTANPWSGAPVFFLGTTIGVVGEHLTPNMAFHEFSHPVFRSMWMNEKSLPLFNKLYDELSQTDEGQKIVALVEELYKDDYAKDSNHFKEEVLVRALADAAESLRNNIPQSTGFKAFLTKVMYQIKQWFRKNFLSPIKIENLGINATMEDLAKMLTNDKFKIDTSILDKDDITSYMKDLQKMKDELQGNEDLAKGFLQHERNIFSRDLMRAIQKKKYPEMLEYLKNDMGLDEFTEMRKNVSKYRQDILSRAQTKEEEIRELDKQVTDFVSSLGSLDTMAKNMADEIERISNLPAGDIEESKTRTLKVQRMMDFLKYWEYFLVDKSAGAREQLITRNLGNTELVGSINKINNNIIRARKASDNILKTGVADLISDIFSEARKTIDDSYGAIIEKARREGKTKLAKSYEDEYHEVRTSPSKIIAQLSGMGDAGMLNNILEGWTYSSDETLGGLGIFFKNTLNNINTATQSRLTEFIRDIIPMMKEAGINVNSKDISAMARPFLFEDTDSKWEGDELKQYKVWTFLNRNKDYRWARADINRRLYEANQKAESGNEEDLAALAELEAEKESFDKEFYRPYVDEYYDLQRIFDSPIGKIAKSKRDKLISEISNLERSAEKETEFMQVTSEMLVKRKDLRQLSSLRDLNGNLKTGEDLEIAKVLQEHRAASRYFYEQKELKPGEFQKRLEQYYEELKGLGLVPGTPLYEERVNRWIKANTVKATKEEYYSTIRYLYNQLQALNDADDAVTEDEKALTAAYKEKSDLIMGYRDQNNQPVATDMSAKTLEKIKAVEEKILELKDKINPKLSSGEKSQLEFYTDMLDNGETLAPEDQQEFSRLYAIQNGKDPNKKRLWAERQAIWKMLRDMQYKDPTEYYLDVINNYFNQSNGDELTSLLSNEDLKFGLGTNEEGFINADNADFVINAKDSTGRLVIQNIIDTVPGFKEWFEANHIQKSYFDRVLKQKVSKWARTDAWSVNTPVSKDAYETTLINDSEGNLKEITGKPSSRFYRTSIKKEFHTGYNIDTGEVDPEVGKVVDVFGNWLPRIDSKFTNQEYINLENADPDSPEGKRFKALEEIKKRYLDFQKGADGYAQLYYDFPRLATEGGITPGLEEIQKGGYAQDKMAGLKAWFSNMRSLVKRREDDPELSANYTADQRAADQVTIANERLFTPQQRDKQIPVHGIYKLDINNVSLDLFHGIAQYMWGVESQKQLTEILPFFKATKGVVEDPANAIRNMKGIEKKNWESEFGNRPVDYVKQGQGSVRSKVVNTKIDRYFYGERNAGVFADNKAVNGIVNAMFKTSAFSFLALQFPSMVTNMTVQVTQNVIQAASGENFTPGNLLRGSIDAGRILNKIAAEIHTKGVHSLDVQLVEIFDGIPGYAHKELGKSQGRSWLRDFASFSWLFSPRKYMENFATLQGFSAMMRKSKVEQNINGNSRIIDYMDAWELRDGKITLKEGIDQSYAQGGKEFNRILNLTHQIAINMNGAYDDFNQPDAHRYLLYRMYAFLRKYITTMLTNRFASIRFSPGEQKAKRGFYTETGKMLYRALAMDPSKLFPGAKFKFENLTPQEKIAARKFLTEIGLIGLMTLMYGLFDWDPNDPDRYEKLRNKSGSLPLPFVTDTGRDFQLSGWLSNHGLLQLLKLKDQTQMWIPLPGMGLQDYTSLSQITPIAFGPTISQAARIVNNGLELASGKPDAYYQRTIGPFDWQQDESPKMYNYLGQLVGMRGTLADPTLAILKRDQSRVLK